MDMNFNLNLTQEQKLIMTQQMQLSIKLLQMSSQELQEHIEKEVQENPVIEYSEPYFDKEEEVKNRVDYKELVKYLDFDKYGQHHYERSEDEEVSPFNFVSEKMSLKKYLADQIIDLYVKDYLKFVCEYIIDNIDNKGYLDIRIEDISQELNIKEEIVIEALNLVQSLDPPGIAARNIKECLKLQLKRKNMLNEELDKIIDEHLENIADNKYSLIAKALNIEVREAQEYGDIIKSLEPKPSSGFYTGDEVRYVVPDAYIRKIGDDYHIIMNDDLLPRFNINDSYKKIINDENNKEAVEYIKDKMNSAMFLIKSIEHRKSTIYKVLEKIVELQRDYFECGINFLKPMTLKDISESIDMHESTVSRAVKDKYINTSRGTIKLKDLFTTGLSSNTDIDDVSTSVIKKEIKGLIDNENKEKPLSDQNICDILNDRGMNISRRTVAKYREELNIKSSSKRKRF
ncbi:RNA polymerase sigma-54 factor [Clostridiales bacterium oral taxon 876 str. F0540]|nr:RNA polymerase sigma-54 factor [Clostridiales bacterium oral taxon 876 str. F0540]